MVKEVMEQEEEQGDETCSLPPPSLPPSLPLETKETQPLQKVSFLAVMNSSSCTLPLPIRPKAGYMVPEQSTCLS